MVVIFSFPFLYPLQSSEGRGGEEAQHSHAACQPAPGPFLLVYTINEPAAAGAYQALKAFGVEDNVLIVSIDGGCPGIRNVAAGVIGASAMQYPLRMAALGVEAVVAFVQTGQKPDTTPGLDFYDTGVTLVTDQPVPGLPSLSAEAGLQECWG